jgi:hypothetical protein
MQCGRRVFEALDKSREPQGLAAIGMAYNVVPMALLRLRFEIYAEAAIVRRFV